MRQVFSFRGALTGRGALSALAFLVVGQMLVVGMLVWAFGTPSGMALPPLLAGLIGMIWMALAVWILAAAVTKLVRRLQQAGSKA